MAQNLKLPDRISTPAFKAAQKLIDRVAKDGITDTELTDVEKELTNAFGDEATLALMWASAESSAGLTELAVHWLQSRAPKMGAQLANFQIALREHDQQPQSLLVDSNNDGQADADDLVLVPNSEGRFVAKQMGQALGDRVKVSAAVVRAAEAFADAGVGFPTWTTNYIFNEKLWSEADEDNARTVRPGVRPSEALADIFTHGQSYNFDCATALVVVLYKAILDLLGPDAFDAAFPDLKVGPWKYDDKLKSIFPWGWLSETQSPYVVATPERRAQLRPGDVTYYNNWDVSRLGIAAGWMGENVIYLGNGRFFGHPKGIFTEETIVKQLNEHRFKGATRDASLSAKQLRLNTRFLTWGKTDPSSGSTK